MLDAVSNRLFTEPPTFTSSQRSPLTTLAIRTFAELGLSLALGAICAPVAVTPLFLWKGMAIQSAINLTIRSFCSVTNRSQDNWLTAATFAFGSLQNIQILIHELGHAMAAECLLQRTRSKIQLLPYVSGTTSFHVSQPTTLGKWVGLQKIQPITTAAGPGLAVVISSLQLWIGLKQLASKPTLAKILISTAIINFIFHAKYAFSARLANPRQLAHDFVELKAYGLNPLYAAITILAIPCLIILQSTWKKPPHPKSAPLALLPCHI